VAIPAPAVRDGATIYPGPRRHDPWSPLPRHDITQVIDSGIKEHWAQNGFASTDLDFQLSSTPS